MENTFYGVIYKIENSINKKVYIGQTVDFKNRKFCSIKCASLNRKKYKTEEEIERYKEERRKKSAERFNIYYHSVFKKKPNWRQIVSERNKKYILKNKNK